MRTSTAALLLLGLGLSACGDREPSSSLAERAAAISAGMNVDSLLIDGVATAVKYNEASGASFPIPFDARVPNPLRVERAESAAGDAVTFKMNLPPDDGVVSITALPASADEAAARAQAKTTADSLGTSTEGDSAAPGWALASYTTAGTARSGSVWLGKHGERYVIVTSDASASAASAFTPRRDYLLSHWAWTDDGTSLMP